MTANEKMSNPLDEIPREREIPRGTFPTGYLVVLGLLAFMLIAAAGLIGWVYFVEKPANLRRYGRSELSVLGTVPEFQLLERAGTMTTAGSLKGQVWIADFMFTSCAGPCRIMSANMKELQDNIAKIPGAAPRVRFVSITVDPERDTPEMLTKYAEQFKANPDRWFFLTGSYDDIQQLARNGFKLGVEQGNPDSNEPIIHSQSFVLVDVEGRIRGYYDGTNGSEVQELFGDAQRLVEEAF